MKTVYLVRHGETDGNLKQYSQLPSTELSPKGHEGATALADRIANLEVDLLVASPYTRAQQTAEYVSKKVNLPVTTVESFHENMRPEAVRGKTYNEGTQDIYKQYNEDVWLKEKTLIGMENFHDVLERMKQSLTFLESQPQNDIVVVSHGDFLRFFISHILLGQSDNLIENRKVYDSFVRLSNVAITVIEHNQEKWTVKMYNDHSHFADN